MLRLAPLLLLLSMALTSPLRAAPRAQVEQWVEPAMGVEYPRTTGEFIAGARGVLVEQFLSNLFAERSLVVNARDTDSGRVLWRYEDPLGVVSRGVLVRPSDGSVYSLGGRAESITSGSAILRRLDGASGRQEARVVLPVGSAGSFSVMALSADGRSVVVAVPQGAVAEVMGYAADDLKLIWKRSLNFDTTVVISELSVSADGRVVAVGGSADYVGDPYDSDMVWGCVDAASPGVLWTKRFIGNDLSRVEDLAVATLRDPAGETRYRVHTTEFPSNTYFIQDGLEDRTLFRRTINSKSGFVVDDDSGVVYHRGPGGTSLAVRSALTGMLLGGRGLPPGTVAGGWLLDRQSGRLYGTGGGPPASGAQDDLKLVLAQDGENGQNLWTSGDPEAPYAAQASTLVGALPEGEPRHVVAYGAPYTPALPGFTYRVREADGRLGVAFEQHVPQATPATPVALSPTSEEGVWAALLVSQKNPFSSPVSLVPVLPQGLDASLLQRILLFDPATGATLEAIDLPPSGSEPSAAFGYGGAGLLIADKTEAGSADAPVRVRALEVATGAERWAEDLREDAWTPFGVLHAEASGRAVVVWSDTPIVYFPERVGLSLLDAQTGEQQSHGFVPWAHPEGDLLRVRTAFGPFAPGSGEHVIVGALAKLELPNVLQLAAYRSVDGALAWAREADFSLAFPGFDPEVGNVIGDPGQDKLWVTGVLKPSETGAPGLPWVGRVDAVSGDIELTLTVDIDLVETTTGFEVFAQGAEGLLDAELDDVLLHATPVGVVGQAATTSLVSAFSKQTGALLWSRLLDPVTAPLRPVGFAVDPADATVVVFGARDLEAWPTSPFESSASAAAWLDPTTGDVLGNALGSDLDGSRWIVGVADDEGVVFGELRAKPSSEFPRGRLSRWLPGP